MKKIISILLVLIAFNANAQSDSARVVDSTMNEYSKKNIALTLPLKGIVLYAYYASEVITWDRRREPDAFKSLIGSGTKPDSLINVTVNGKLIADFVIRLMGERHGVIDGVIKGVLNNSPAIPGYTSLVNQVGAKLVNGTANEKKAAEYIIWRYNKHSTLLNSITNSYWQLGLDWINN
jgi:hypothetical protein